MRRPDAAARWRWPRPACCCLPRPHQGAPAPPPPPPPAPAGALEAAHWEAFYGIHANRFFKHRYYLRKDWPELMPPAVRADPLAHVPPLDPPSAPPPAADSVRVLELGSGVGNTAYPLVRANPNLVVTCVDCSAAALDVIRASPEFDARRIRTLHRDASCEPVCDEPATFDYVAMVYFLSALDADGRNHAVAEAYRALKPGGELLFRDYAEGDMVQLRMASKDERRANADAPATLATTTAGRAVDRSGKFFRRGDDTLAYFFGRDELVDDMAAHGFELVKLDVNERENVNRKEGKVMHRKFVQGTFLKAG